MEVNSLYAESYLQFITKGGDVTKNNTLTDIISLINENTLWENPESALDLNNVAVIALIEAEHCDNLDMRANYLEMAFEALDSGVKMKSHPLCLIHLALVHSILGEYQQAIHLSYSVLINILQPAYATENKIPLGLIYIPSKYRGSLGSHYEQFEQILKADNGYTQSLLLLGAVLFQSKLVSYTVTGLEILHLAAQLLPNSASINFQLGVSSFVSKPWEGLLYLHLARKLAPESVSVLQALHLAYRDLEQVEVADFWLNAARKLAQSKNVNWHWDALAVNSEFMYVPFDESLLMAVQPSFQSVVTNVLITEGDWFESEMELWRNWVKPGMTVIDVGANVGIYTFSAARRVGSEGCVLAVEPFSGCVSCLSETRKINNLPWVKIFAGAASERNGTARLSIHRASELNQIIVNDVEEDKELNHFAEVPCFSLDSLTEQENISQVDLMKIDVENHEMQVLIGSERILNNYFPSIIYENTGSDNLSVAKYLRNKGYQLFVYKRYIQQLITVTSEENFKNQINIIAIHSSKVNKVNVAKE